MSRNYIISMTRPFCGFLSPSSLQEHNIKTCFVCVLPAHKSVQIEKERQISPLLLLCPSPHAVTASSPQQSRATLPKRRDSIWWRLSAQSCVTVSHKDTSVGLWEVKEGEIRTCFKTKCVFGDLFLRLVATSQNSTSPC